MYYNDNRINNKILESDWFSAIDICFLIDHFTVVCSVTWPLYGSEARVDLVLIQTSLLLLCKTSCPDAN